MSNPQPLDALESLLARQQKVIHGLMCQYDFSESEAVYFMGMYDVGPVEKAVDSLHVEHRRD